MYKQASTIAIDIQFVLNHICPMNYASDTHINFHHQRPVVVLVANSKSISLINKKIHLSSCLKEVLDTPCSLKQRNRIS